MNERSVEVAEVVVTLKDVINQFTDELEALAARVNGNALAENMETFVTDHNKSFNREAFRHATEDILTIMLEDFDVCEDF